MDLDSFEESSNINFIKKILSQPSHLREREDRITIAEYIRDLRYFQTIVNDPVERMDFVTKCAKFLKYEYFPKGFEVVRKGDHGYNFYIILKGEACVFVPKSNNDLQAHMLNDKKKLAFEDYMTYIKKNLIPEASPQQKQKDSTPKNNGKKLLLKRSNSFLLQTASTSSSMQKVKENLARERIFNSDVKIYHGKDPQNDLTFDEKLLILNEKISQPYFLNGIATYKKCSVLRTGGFFGELALLFNQPRTASVIASEDLHLLYLSNEDYKDIFECEIDNLWKKIDFFKLMFTDMSPTLIAKFVYLLEEKRFMHGEVVYKENDPADGIYIIKQGDVQLSTMQEEESQEDPSSPSKTPKIRKPPMYKRKIIVANLSDGSFFGENEIINNITREYTAVCKSSSTLVYKLSRGKYEDTVKQFFHSAYTFLREKAGYNDKIRKAWIKKQQDLHLNTTTNFFPAVAKEPEATTTTKFQRKVFRSKTEGPESPSPIKKSLTTYTRASKIFQKEIMISIQNDENLLSPTSPVKNKEERFFDFDANKTLSPRKTIFASLTHRGSLVMPSPSMVAFPSTITSTINNLPEEKPNQEIVSSKSIQIKSFKDLSNTESPTSPRQNRLVKAESEVQKLARKIQHSPQRKTKETDESFEFGFVDICKQRNYQAAPEELRIIKSPRRIAPLESSPTFSLVRHSSLQENIFKSQNLASSGGSIESPRLQRPKYRKLILNRLKEIPKAASPGTRTSWKLNNTARQLERVRSNAAASTLNTENLETYESYYNNNVSSLSPRGKEWSLPQSVVFSPESIVRVEHENVESNQLLSKKYASTKLSKTKHNLFRTKS